MNLPCKSSLESKGDGETKIYGGVGIFSGLFGYEGICRAVAYPENFEELASLLLYCKRNSIRVSIFGGGTNLFGCGYGKGNVLVDMSRFRNVRYFENAVEAEAGVVLGKLKERLRSMGKDIGFEIASEYGATIGGIIAANAISVDGKFIGDFIEKVWLLSGDGKYFEADIPDVVGSEGRLGVIVKARIKVKGFDRRRGSIDIFGYSTIGGLFEGIKNLSGDGVCCMELFDAYTSQIMGFGEKFHLAVEYLDDRGSIKEDDVDEFWQGRKMLFNKLIERGYYGLGRVRFDEPENAKKFIYWLEKNRIPVFGHMMIGVLHPCLSSMHSSAECLEVVRRLGGKHIGPFGVLKDNVNFDKERIGLLKMKYDTKNVMNPF